jgi:hypothetical protein
MWEKSWERNISWWLVAQVERCLKKGCTGVILLLHIAKSVMLYTESESVLKKE